jgi:hypothetical protein
MIAIPFYFIVCFAMYFIPSGIGAFVQLDWSYFDFTTWERSSRVAYGLSWCVWTFVFVYFSVEEGF